MSFDFCLPTKSDALPTGPNWLHEVKYDGYYGFLTTQANAVVAPIHAKAMPVA